MKTYFLPAAVIAVIIISTWACGKDSNNPDNTTKLLKSYTSSKYSTYKDPVMFGYNADSSIILDEDLFDRQTMDVIGNQLHYIEFRKAENRNTADATFTFNADRNIVSGQGTFSYNATAPYTSQFTFEYDGSGNLIKRTDARNDGNTWVHEYIWSNGDITQIRWLLNTALYLTFNMTYDTQLTDKNKIDGNKFLAITNSFFGNSCAHLPTHGETIFAPGSAITGEYTQTYHLDSDGYVSSMILHYITDPGRDTLNYHYQ